MGADTVFISYSHDSPEHSERVLAFSNKLREQGVDAELDQYLTRPSQGWPQWCEEQLRPREFEIRAADLHGDVSQPRREEGPGRRRSRRLLGRRHRLPTISTRRRRTSNSCPSCSATNPTRASDPAARLCEVSHPRVRSGAIRNSRRSTANSPASPPSSSRRSARRSPSERRRRPRRWSPRRCPRSRR